MNKPKIKELIENNGVYVGATQPTTNESVWIKKGNNLYNKETMLEFTGKYRAGNSGNIITSETNKGLKVPTEPNSTYIITQTGTTSNYHEICFFDSEFNYLSGVAESLTEINTPENCYIMTIQTNINATDIMINKGSTALPYEEYIEKELYVKNDNGVFEKFYKEDEKKQKVVLFNNPSNTANTVQLSDSAYNYSYLYVESSSQLHYVMLPIIKDGQIYLNGIGGWSGEANVGSTHFTGSLSNNGKTLTATYFKTMVHTESSSHSAGTDRKIVSVIGVR